jgi:hypothetical protein
MTYSIERSTLPEIATALNHQGMFLGHPEVAA